MKIGLVLCAFNRPEYLQRCIDSLRRARRINDISIYVIDDCSTNETTRDTIGFFAQRPNVKMFRNEQNRGIAYSVKRGYEEAFKDECNLVMNLDSDALVRNDFISVLQSLYERHPAYIITGFHSLNVNERTGQPRHRILEHREGYCLKESVGGINMAMGSTVYTTIVKPVLEEVIVKGGNWDHKVCIHSMKLGKGIVTSVPSVIQHIGFDSSMQHTEAPDVASDFKALALLNVTLLTVNCDNISDGIHAIEQSTKHIQFGVVKILTSSDIEYPGVVKIQPIRSVREYSVFMMKSLQRYVDTDYVLIVQGDGYVKNVQAWDDLYFLYDYIGATWWYRDGFNVGNGGFCLRSKRLLKALSDKFIRKLHPEDHQICRTYRRFLEKKYGIIFAPDSLANRFSVEGAYQEGVHYVDQFGFHGFSCIIPKKKLIKNLIINQYQGLGDILFCIPLVRTLMSEGYNVIWPVIDKYISIQKHFSDITFVSKSLIAIDYDRRDEYDVNGSKVIPLRWAVEKLGRDYVECMKAKYDLMGMDWRMWRELRWERDIKAEDGLYDLLEINLQQYRFVNKRFRSDSTGVVDISLDGGMRNIEMKEIEGYTMLDWRKVIENATEIHTVGTSINYVLEMLNVSNKIHLYLRKPDESDFKNYNYLLTKDYEFHF